ncbi:hypothetical protein RB1923 [Rhodopirellula baltica SH 1]|uniref:Uncharacterized protein n=1 Tax=Rhodopirellula baltica (strain DSM 10527 / NCIMB 13988 / SH1) TaxID=243090 RepID=Q7UWM6_RHOBA|nr:hypothetical protein RB1923 [Rhodopirellula baltica SH 1]
MNRPTRRVRGPSLWVFVSRYVGLAVSNAPVGGLASLFWSPDQTQNVHPGVGVKIDGIVGDQRIGTAA